MFLSSVRAGTDVLDAYRKPLVAANPLFPFEHVSELRDVGGAQRTRDDCTDYLARHAMLHSDLADAELIIAELIANIIQHANGAGSFTMTWHGKHPKLDVVDSGPGHPVVCTSTLDDPFAETGRGIAIIRALAIDMDFGNKSDGGSYFTVLLPVTRVP